MNRSLRGRKAGRHGRVSTTAGRRQKSGCPERQLSPYEGKKKLRLLTRQYCGFLRELEHSLASIGDRDLCFVVAFLLDALADEDDCASLTLAEINDTQFRLNGLLVEDEILTALTTRYTTVLVQAGRSWISDWLGQSGVPFPWLGWRFGHVDIEGRRGEKNRIEVNHMVYDFAERRTLGLTLWDGPTMYKSTLLPIKGWNQC